MKCVKEMVYEILEVLRGECSVEELGSNSAVILLLGHYSCISDKVNLDLIHNSTDIKEAVKEALDIIGGEEKSLKGPISYLSNLKLSNEQLSKIIVILKRYSFDKELFKKAFEFILEQVEELSGKFGGEEITPKFFNKLAVEIVEPKNGEFYDGVFGFGGDAIEAYKFAAKYGNELKINGQELDLKTYSIACIRMFINGINSADIRIGDVLTNPIFKEDENVLKKYDSIIMAPPLGLGWKDKESQIINDKYSRFIYGLPGVANADWLFILSALKSLKEEGKAVIISTLGSLFRAGAEENLRKKLIGFDYIETVIEFAGGLLTNTAIPCAMMVINMNKSQDMKNKIQFINADEIYENVRRGKRILNDDNINTILDIYRGKNNIDDVSEIVSLENIEGGNLLPSRYVVKTEFNSSEYGKVKIHLDKLNASKKLGEIGTFYRGINVTSKNLADIKDGKLNVDLLPTYTIENNARVEAYKVEAGDIIISNKGATKICIIPEHEGDVLISQNFIGIRVKSSYNPEYIKEFLESPIGDYLIDSRKTGTAVAMINVKDLKELPIVEMSIAEQNEIIKWYLNEEEELKNQMKALKTKMNELKFDLYRKMHIENTYEIM